MKNAQSKIKKFGKQLIKEKEIREKVESRKQKVVSRNKKIKTQK